MLNWPWGDRCAFLYRFALKSVPGLADAGVPQGDGDGPRTPPRCLVGVRKNHQMTPLTMPNTIFSMKLALKSVPGHADVGVPHGDEDGPRTPSRCIFGGQEKSSND